MHEDWLKLIGEEFEKPYYVALNRFITKERLKYTVYPEQENIFRALNLTLPEDVKVVLIGQDPYHGPLQANGLSFSVARGITPPPSLRNIFKEVIEDVGINMPSHGDLTAWATQGVLLLNATLTVRKNEPGAHQNKGWEQFTDAIIKALNAHYNGLIFLLWGNYAKQKKALIDQRKHHILTAAHPSPFAAHRGFFGCRHFSTVNQLLKEQGKSPINWQV